MIDKPTPPREPIRLPQNARDTTAEHVGTTIGIVGGTAPAKAQQPDARTPGDPVPLRPAPR
jgi:hypothetical protein